MTEMGSISLKELCLSMSTKEKLLILESTNAHCELTRKNWAYLVIHKTLDSGLNRTSKVQFVGGLDNLRRSKCAKNSNYKSNLSTFDNTNLAAINASDRKKHISEETRFQHYQNGALKVDRFFKTFAIFVELNRTFDTITHRPHMKEL